MLFEDIPGCTEKCGARLLFVRVADGIGPQGMHALNLAPAPDGVLVGSRNAGVQHGRRCGLSHQLRKLLEKSSQIVIVDAKRESRRRAELTAAQTHGRRHPLSY